MLIQQSPPGTHARSKPKLHKRAAAAVVSQCFHWFHISEAAQRRWHWRTQSAECPAAGIRAPSFPRSSSWMSADRFMSPDTKLWSPSQTHSCGTCSARSHQRSWRETAKGASSWTGMGSCSATSSTISETSTWSSRTTSPRKVGCRERLTFSSFGTSQNASIPGWVKRIQSARRSARATQKTAGSSAAPPAAWRLYAPCLSAEPCAPRLWTLESPATSR